MKELESAKIDVKSFSENYKTITKTRYLGQGQQILRVDCEERYSKEASIKIINYLTTIIKDCDIVVLSDYDKGVLEDIPSIIKLAKTYSKLIYIDPKQNNPEVYAGANFITPNINEAETLFGCKNLKEYKNLNITDYKIDNVIITMSDQGAMILNKDGAEHIPAKIIEVVDVTGAGDCFISALVYTHTKLGRTVQESVDTAVKVSSTAVSKKGNYILTEKDFNKKKIVFTNGCFDILHAGHIDYLSQAAKLGDKLIVGLNDDASVRKLKGDKRPINNFENRRLLIESLSFVDEVIGFTEDTPEKLIKSIKPDVLVKGADYTKRDIVGAKFVESYGGKVRTIDFKYEVSTTSLLNKINV